MSRFKNIKMTKREKVLLTLVIAEVQACANIEEVKVTVASWVTANDLHPEKVETLNQDEFKRFLQSEIK